MVSDLGTKGEEDIFCIAKHTLASRFSQHPLVPAWHASPPILNFAAHGVGGLSSRGSLLLHN